MNMRNNSYVLLASLMLLLVTSCAYHGSLKKDFYKSSPFHIGKIPLSVAIDDSGRRITTVQATGGLGDSYHINAKDGLVTATKKALETIFEKVKILDSGSNNGINFIVEPSLKVNLVSKSLGSGRQVFVSELCLIFRDPKNGSVVANYCDKRSIEIAPSSSTNALSFLTGFSLFILSPITIPAIAQIEGKHGVSLLEQALAKSIDIVSDDIVRDKKNLMFANQNIRIASLKTGQDVNEQSMAVQALSLSKEPKVISGSEYRKKLAIRWAVVIGLSEYQDSRIPALRYASTDAIGFYDWTISTQGGKYAPSRVKLLLNKEATAKNIKDALFEWLAHALEEDLVIIYFAGHGSPQSPDQLGNLFLLPYDTDYDKVATTGFPMWDIETALKRFIKAKKVVVIADACHSGGIGQSFDLARRRKRGLEVNPITAGLQNLSQIGDGVCVISATNDKQFSQESKEWGSGHGVFTYFLLKGLKGEADYSKDGKVTLGELIPYVSEWVRRSTKSAQCPTVAGRFDNHINVKRFK